MANAIAGLQPMLLIILLLLVQGYAIPTTGIQMTRAVRSSNASPNRTEKLSVPTAFHTYLSNPSDFATILLIIGGDIVRKTLAQLSGSRYGAPIAFSFGWVSYSFSALASVVGDGKLMPKPELSSLVINVNSGYARTNNSWVLNRILRDLELNASRIRGGLSVSILHAVGKGGVPKRDWVWYIGVFVIPIQLGIALVPWVLCGNWSIFMVTASGTLLALCGSMLPQWAAEKWDGDRRVNGSYCLTRGNGYRHVFVIQNHNEGALNLEDLATSHVQLHSRTEHYSRAGLACIALLWMVFIICTGALEEDIWYLLGAGSLGMLQNIVVAGAKRTPAAHGIDLQLQEIIEGDRVMPTLQTVEKRFPRTGLSLLPIFFPGDLWPDEAKFWADKKGEVNRAKHERIAAKMAERQAKLNLR